MTTHDTEVAACSRSLLQTLCRRRLMGRRWRDWSQAKVDSGNECVAIILINYRAPLCNVKGRCVESAVVTPSEKRIINILKKIERGEVAGNTEE